MFGGFILHFLLCNYLTVLLRPRYEEPVENAADLINRDIIPFYDPGGEMWIQFFAASSDPNYREISKRLIIAKDYYELDDLAQKVTSTGMFAQIATFPYAWEEDYKYWYRSSEKIGGTYPFVVHLSNKKWPFKKVF